MNSAEAMGHIGIATATGVVCLLWPHLSLLAIGGLLFWLVKH